MYRYRAYNLTIASAFALPELLEVCSSAEPDVVIRTGEVPEQLSHPLVKTPFCEVKEKTFLLRLELGGFLVKDGREITVAPAVTSHERDVRLFLLGTCIGALLHQRGILALHASAIETPHGAVLFTGPSGVGKSTTLQAFLKRGYRMLADDVTGVVLKEGELLALPAFPRNKLWADAAARLGVATNDLDYVREGYEKFNVPQRSSFLTEPSKVRRLYVLDKGNDLSLTPLSKAQGFSAVLTNTYRAPLVGGLAMQTPHFDLATALARQIDVVQVRRPERPDRLDKLIDRLEHDMLRRAAPTCEFGNVPGYGLTTHTAL